MNETTPLLFLAHVQVTEEKRQAQGQNQQQSNDPKKDEQEEEHCISPATCELARELPNKQHETV